MIEMVVMVASVEVTLLVVLEEVVKEVLILKQ